MDIILINETTNNTIIFDDKTFIANQILTDNTSVAHTTKKTIKQIGENITNSAVSSRSISIVGYIIGASEQDLINNKKLLLNLINPLQEITIQANGLYQIKAKPTATVQWGKNWSNNNNCFTQFALDFLAPSTLWEDINPSIINFKSYENMWKFPFTLTDDFIFGEYIVNREVSIYNKSNVTLGVIFSITVTGEVINPSIINVLTGERMNLDIVLQPEDNLIITSNYNSKIVTLNGKADIKVFKFLESDWLMINPGENTFTYTTENNSDKNVNIEIKYFNAYWGIV